MKTFTKQRDGKYHVTKRELQDMTGDFVGVSQGIGNPDTAGRRMAFESCFTGKAGSVLIFEGWHFIVDDDPRFTDDYLAAN